MLWERIKFRDAHFVSLSFTCKLVN